MSRPYYVLCELMDNGRWSLAFGDYFKSVVKSEYDDYRDHGTPAKRLRILQTGELQSEIDEAVARLN